jgi:hypothetical protein
MPRLLQVCCVCKVSWEQVSFARYANDAR